MFESFEITNGSGAQRLGLFYLKVAESWICCRQMREELTVAFLGSFANHRPQMAKQGGIVEDTLICTAIYVGDVDAMVAEFLHNCRGQWSVEREAFVFNLGVGKRRNR
jgi:hypothetical protein